MGYSSTAAAALASDAMLALLTERGPVYGSEGGNGLPSSNSWESDGRTYFAEQGRENEDGAVTGSVYRMLSDGRARRVGSYRVEPDGRVSRWASVSASDREAATAKGAEEFARLYTRPLVTVGLREGG